MGGSVLGLWKHARTHAQTALPACQVAGQQFRRAAHNDRHISRVAIYEAFSQEFSFSLKGRAAGRQQSQTDERLPLPPNLAQQGSACLCPSRAVHSDSRHARSAERAHGAILGEGIGTDSAAPKGPEQSRTRETKKTKNRPAEDF